MRIAPARFEPANLFGASRLIPSVTVSVAFCGFSYFDVCHLGSIGPKLVEATKLKRVVPGFTYRVVASYRFSSLFNAQTRGFEVLRRLLFVSRRGRVSG